VLILFEFLQFYISAYTTLNELLAVFFIYNLKISAESGKTNVQNATLINCNHCTMQLYDQEQTENSQRQ